MKQKTTIIVALVAVAGLAVAAKTVMRDVQPVNYASAGSYSIIGPSSASATLQTNKTASTFPATIAAGSTGAVTIANSGGAGLVTYQVGSDSCSYMLTPLANSPNGNVAVNYKDGQSVKCRLNVDQQSAKVVSFAITADSAG